MNLARCVGWIGCGQKWVERTRLGGAQGRIACWGLQLSLVGVQLVGVPYRSLADSRPLSSGEGFGGKRVASGVDEVSLASVGYFAAVKYASKMTCFWQVLWNWFFLR